jgi:hypothetical protein
MVAPGCPWHPADPDCAEGDQRTLGLIVDHLGVFVKYQLHQDKEIFEKAYGYIEQYY